MDGRSEQHDVMPHARTGLRRAVSELARSVAHGRPMTWPNFRRLAARTQSTRDSLPPDQIRTIYDLARLRG